MKVILKENIENLGSKGDIVNVAAGFGRNYLIPKKLALEVTSSNMKMIEMEQAALKKRLEKTRMSYQDVIEKLNATALSFIRKAAEKDVIFGSVSVADIKEELDKAGFEIEKKKILLSEPIKRLGNYTVPIKVFLDDLAEIKVQVTSEEELKKEREAFQEEARVTEAEEKEEPESVKEGEAGVEVKEEIDVSGEAHPEEKPPEETPGEGPPEERKEEEAPQESGKDEEISAEAKEQEEKQKASPEDKKEEDLTSQDAKKEKEIPQEESQAKEESEGAEAEERTEEEVKEDKKAE